MPGPSPDTEEYRRVPTTKASSQKRNDVTKSKKNDTIIRATKTAMDRDMGNINRETLFNKVEFPCAVPVEDLKHTSLHKYSFCARKISNVQLAGRLKNFIKTGKF